MDTHAHHSDHHVHHDHGSPRTLALAATLHCLTGCAIGEILGLVIGTAAGLASGWTVALSITLAFTFGYLLSTLPVLKAGAGVAAALGVVLAADTLSIATMEVVDNAVVLVIPGAMDAGLVNPTFWVSLVVALTAAFVAAYPVNVWLLGRGKGHALTHAYHGAAAAEGWRRWLPTIATSTLVVGLLAFVLGGLVVSVAA